LVLVADVAETSNEQTLDQALRERLGRGNVRLGAHVRFGLIALYVRGLTTDGTIERVGMVILPDEPEKPDGESGS
jgi:hypothetical protein